MTSALSLEQAVISAHLLLVIACSCLALACTTRAALFLARRAASRSALADAGLHVVDWTPRWALSAPYTASPRNLLETVRSRCRASPAAGAFGVVLGETPVVHVGEPHLARALLHAAGSFKAPWYNAFKGFVGEGLFTADGDDWCAAAAHTSSFSDSFTSRAGAPSVGLSSRRSLRQARVPWRRLQLVRWPHLRLE